MLTVSFAFLVATILFFCFERTRWMGVVAVFVLLCIMLAFAFHLLELGADLVEIRPDGMHGKGFDFPLWLRTQGFEFKSTGGQTNFAGKYERGSHSILIACTPGIGDVAWHCCLPLARLLTNDP